MQHQAREFAQVDVFASVPYLGNPVAVVLEADGLDEATMATFARWTNLSETTFVLPPTAPEADYRLRIFTPTAELPFAGHPTLGSAHAWLEAGNEPQRPDVIVQECAAGLVQLRRSANTLSFVTPPTLRSGPLDDALLRRIVRGIGIDPDQVVDHQWVDNGTGWVAVLLPSADAVLAVEPDFTQLEDLMVGLVGPYPSGSDFLYEVRGFAPKIGIPEDPVTGSLNASIAQWLLRTGRVMAPYRASQGARVGRQGVIMIDTTIDGNVLVGGTSTTYIRGAVVL